MLIPSLSLTPLKSPGLVDNISLHICHTSCEMDLHNLSITLFYVLHLPGRLLQSNSFFVKPAFHTVSYCFQPFLHVVYVVYETGGIETVVRLFIVICCTHHRLPGPP